MVLMIIVFTSCMPLILLEVMCNTEWDVAAHTKFIYIEIELPAVPAVDLC